MSWTIDTVSVLLSKNCCTLIHIQSKVDIYVKQTALLNVHVVLCLHKIYILMLKISISRYF